ncbi:MAG: hypothetical protein JO265_09330 [Acidimicrobiia bacterium]|nr:hypothetical protein [Acidimicrobiia bacterium]
MKRLVDAGLVAVGDGASAHADESETGDVGESDEAVAEAVEAFETDAAEEGEADETTGADGEQPDPHELVSIPEHLRGPRRRPSPAVEPEPEPVRPPARLSPMAIAAARRRAELAELADPSNGDLVGATAAALTPENASALVRELAELGSDTTEAVEVIEAASRAPSTEAKTAALEGVLANDEGAPLNRALLMKFLSSVRT